MSFPPPPRFDGLAERSSVRLAVVIPCYRCKDQILRVLDKIGPEVDRVFVVDDACPDATGQWVLDHLQDPRVQVLFHPENRGVGGAVITGYEAAIDAGMDIVVKVDGDGQMDPGLIHRFVLPIAAGAADYTKGNRFFRLGSLREMPRVRLLGNAALSFIAKLSTGYWSQFDVTNGYTAIHTRVLPHLELEKVSRRYFFETDLLFRLGTLRARVVDIPMDARYADEESNLRILKVLPEFAAKNVAILGKRILYNYFLRDLNAASFALLLGTLLLGFGVTFGVAAWMDSWRTGITASTGTVMLAALPTLVGFQMLLTFIGHDVANQPTHAIHPLLPPLKEQALEDRPH